MMRGLRCKQTSGPSPSRSITPGRNPSKITSDCSTILSTSSTASGCLRSSAMLFRPRPRMSTPRRCCSPERATLSTRSMRTTSAPMSASIMPQNGPGPMPATSITLIPLSGPIVNLPSAPDELGLALFEEGDHRAAVILAELAHLPVVRLEVEQFRVGVRLGESDVRLHAGVSRGRAGGETGAERESLGHQIVVRHDAVGDAKLQRLLGADALGQHQDRERAGAAD